MAAPRRVTEGSRFGRFLIERELGAGGMGRVYRAHDPTLNRPVAIKLLHDAGAAAAGRLLAEARSASALNHPNICTVYEVGEVNGLPFIAMELVAGRPLSSIISTTMSPDMLARLGVQIAAALAHADARGVVHGDLRPQNVMVTDDWSVKLLDFGLARTLEPSDVDAMTRTTAPLAQEVAGTLPYMSPEAVRGARPTTAADVWALGVLLHEMASGRRPFSDPSAFDIAHAILNAAPPPVPRSLSPSFAAVVRRCLQKDPALRYATAHDAVVGLEAATADARGVTARHDNPDHVAAVAYARARMGRKREAEEALRGLLRLRNGTQRYVSAHAIGLAYTGLGNRDEAIAWLERARHEHAWAWRFWASSQTSIRCGRTDGSPRLLCGNAVTREPPGRRRAVRLERPLSRL